MASDIFHCVQTFYIDPNTVQNADQVLITSIDLFCSYKPPLLSTLNIPNLIPQNGVQRPGVTLFIVPVTNRKPSFDILSNYPSTRREYDDITGSEQFPVKTNFSFSNPVPLKTGKEYGVVIKHDFNAAFTWWKSKENELIVGTNGTAAGPAGQYIGNYFEYSSNFETWNPLNDTDLKFAIYCARFKAAGNNIGGSDTFELTMKHLEYVRFNELNSQLNFIGSELVWQEQANLAGNVSVTNNSIAITGNGTSFDSHYVLGNDPEYIVLVSGNTYNIRRVVTKSSNTYLTVDYPCTFTNAAAKYYKAPVAELLTIKNSMRDGSKSKLAVLFNSTANGTMYFENSKRIIGEDSGSYFANVEIVDISVNGFAPQLDIQTPPQTDYTATVTTNYTKDGSNTTIKDLTPVTRNAKSFQIYEFGEDDGVVIPSWSNEIQLLSGNVFSSTPSQASVFLVDPSSDNDFVSPYIQVAGASMYYYRYVINNDYTNENTKYGNAFSKHITSKVNLADDNSAEDVLVYMTAIRPSGTDLKVFAKIWNKNDTDAFDDKDWTLLEYTSESNGVYSANSGHLVELSYKLSQFPNTAITSNGSVTTTLNQSNVIGIGTSFNTNFANNDMVKIYPPLFPNNYVIATVNSVTNSTHLVLSSTISNSSITGAGLKIDRIDYKYQAFSNKDNDNIVRYYNSEMVPFDTYNSLAIKVVFLSNSQFVVPKVKDIRAASVSS